jgi:hypothetical protein
MHGGTRVAIKHEKEEMLDINGKITNDESKLCGRKTHYQLIKPERCVYVDKTGCSTNMKEDGHVGGCRYVMGKVVGLVSLVIYILLYFLLRQEQER